MSYDLTICGWTDEDVEIWRQREMKPHTILYRYQHHVKECELMTALTRSKWRPGEAKMLLVALKGGK